MYALMYTAGNQPDIGTGKEKGPGEGHEKKHGSGWNTGAAHHVQITPTYPFFLLFVARPTLPEKV